MGKKKIKKPKYDRMVSALNEFRDAAIELMNDKNSWSEAVNEADKAFGDIRHKCEIDFPTKSSEKTKICRLMEEYSLSRREYKDALDVLSPLITFLSDSKNRTLLQEIGRVTNEVNKKVKHSESERKYTPRVLVDLFEKKS